MPATSKAQQRLMGLVKAVQAGDVPKSKVTKKIRQMAKDMKKKDVDKYAGTKHKGLPNKVEENSRAIKKSISKAKKGAVAKGGGYAPFIKMGKNFWKQPKTNTKTHDDGIFDKIGGFKDFVIDEGKGPCWSGYKQVGMKKKGDRMVPNCVPIKDAKIKESFREFAENAPNTADAMKRYKAGKAGFTDKAHLKAKGLIPRADGEKKKSDKYK